MKWVMSMNIFENTIVTEIHPPMTVYSQKGRVFQMEHRKTYGLGLCLRGQIRYVMDGKEYLSDPNHGILLPKGGSYRLYREKEGLFPLINFDCEALPCEQILSFPLQDPQACLQDFEELKSAFLLHENRLKIFSIFYSLLSKVSNDYPPDSSFLHSIIGYIQDHLSDPDLSNSLLAEKMGISEVYFRKRFTACFHTTPKQYILDLRIRKAMQMLAQSPDTVTFISEACGFSSLYHFCKVFKVRTGMTPSQFAAQNRIFRI